MVCPYVIYVCTYVCIDQHWRVFMSLDARRSVVLIQRHAYMQVGADVFRLSFSLFFFFRPHFSQVTY